MPFASVQQVRSETGPSLSGEIQWQTTFKDCLEEQFKKAGANFMATQVPPEVTLLNQVFLDMMNGRKVQDRMLHICLH